MPARIYSLGVFDWGMAIRSGSTDVGLEVSGCCASTETEEKTKNSKQCTKRNDFGIQSYILRDRQIKGIN
jgi:hypothetical protein